MTFCRFLGLSLNDKVPDEKTIWDFRDKLISKGIQKELFVTFTGLLEKHGLIAQEGKIIDASFVEAPRQRNSREKNNQSYYGYKNHAKDDSAHKFIDTCTTTHDFSSIKAKSHTLAGFLKSNYLLDIRALIVNL